MDLSDHETLLAPISDDEPCGPDLEYDAEFGEMERAAQSSEEQQFGDTIVEAEPPDWKDVKKRAEALLSRTKDMRVVAYLARATLNQDGVIGFSQAVHLLRSYLETFWDTVHPELDHEDNDDPTYRMNTLITFCDEQGIMKELRDAPLVASRTVGRFSLRDVEHAREAAENPTEEDEAGEAGSKGPTLAVIEAAFSDTDIETIQATEEALRSAAEDIDAIEKFVTQQVGVTFAVSLAPPRLLLEEMDKFVVSQLERRGVYADQAEAETADESGWGDSSWDDSGGGDTDSSGDAAAAPPPAAQGYRVNGKITSRKEAIKALDDVCDFYEENEPSSPLPLLIRRAQRLASKSFLDILRDLAPDAVSQAEALGGSSDSSDSSSSSSDSDESAADDSSTW
ncbi:type VI secretion system protein TssA [Stieleria mannarensis]|uniref:type VI secretion system protein TssA n=1 Tax=Stieleria mannarensis TaxID=2755585 RepID=UPI0015FFE54E|nr:type VI secretion system protein TssA [Rhodopirellula sp. JC639]